MIVKIKKDSVVSLEKYLVIIFYGLEVHLNIVFFRCFVYIIIVFTASIDRRID